MRGFVSRRGLRRFGLLQPSRSDRLLNLERQVGANEQVRSLFT